MTEPDKILLQLIDEIAVNLKYDKYKVQVKSIASEGGNFTTVLFVATISADEKEDIEIFAKVANLGEAVRSQLPIDHLFMTERYFYTNLLQKYEQIQEEHGISSKHKLNVAKYFGSNSEPGKEILVLENLCVKGFSTYDRSKSVDWRYASKSVEELAKLHALSISYSEKYPYEFKKMITKFKPMFEGRNEELKLLWGLLIPTSLAAVNEKHRDRLRNYVSDSFFDDFIKYLKPLRRPMLVHGDYRPSNLMHKIHTDGSLEVMIIDYQTLHAGRPVIDLLYFIFTSSDEEFRRNYYENLLEHYYTQLSLSLQRLNLNPDKVYSRDDFEYELKETLPYGLSIAVCALQVVTVETDNAPKLDGTALTIKTSDVFPERLNGIVNDYVRWGVI